MSGKCDDYSYLLNDYIDKNLNKEELEGLEAHLKNCKNCKEELIELQETVKRIKELSNMKIPDAKETFASEIITQLKEENKTAKRGYLKYIAASVITISLVCFTAVNFLHTEPTKIANNTTENITEEEYTDYFSTITEDNDTFIIAEAGYPTDEYGLIDLDGILTDD
ncbi:MAG: anti-sigma factor [Vampirovibrionia bacterium]